MADQRRRKMNLLLQPALQLKLPVVLLIATLGFSALQVAHIHFAYDQLFDTVLEEAGHPLFLEDLLRDQTRDFMEVTAEIAFVYVLVIVALSAGYVHRMIGPMVPFRRHVEALKNGDYSARVTLRKRDAFTNLANDLNELARTLEQNEKEREPSALPPADA